MKNLELTKVRENLEQWLAAFNAKDIGALLSLYDPESVYANAGSPLMTGVDQIKPWYENVFPVLSGQLLYKEETAFIEGNMAMLIGKYYFQPPADSPEDAEGATGRVVLVYRKSIDGRWLLLFDMDNTPPDILPSDF